METKATSYDFLEAGTTIQRGNVTSHVTDALRQAIVTLEMRPGDLIDKLAICARLGVSRFPVSEALARLQNEGLVDIQPQRGTTVALIRIADVSEHMLIRRAIEAEAVRTLVQADIPDLPQMLAASLEKQREAAQSNDAERFHQSDCAFHELLFTAMQFGKVKAIIDNVRANVDRARRLITSNQRIAPTLAEHERIYQAILARNPDQAASAMRDHIDAVMAEVLAFAKREPQHFADGADFADTPEKPTGA